MKANRNWYVLYVQGGKETFLRDMINRRGDVVAFVPMMERLYKIRGEYKEAIKPMFPSYLFIKTDQEQAYIETLFQEYRLKLRGFRKLLKYDEEGTSVLQKEEVAFLDAILDEEYVLRMSKGKIVSGILMIENGPLVGQEANIRKVDRHKCIAYLYVKVLDKEVIAGMIIKEKTNGEKN